mgnify:CR=1 FL=1
MEIDVTTRKNGTRRVRLTLSSETRTEQSHAKRVNINSIMAKVARGGMAPIKSGSPLYGDFSNVGDYQQCKDRIIAAQMDFNQLPANIRAEFDNDPAKLIAYLNNPENEQDAIDQGLLPGEGTEAPPVEEDVAAANQAADSEGS